MRPNEDRLNLPGCRPPGGLRAGFRAAGFAALAALFLTSGVFAQNQPPPVRKTAPSNRFLFVVDTSSAMKKQIEPILMAVKSILANNANRQMRTGDTLGIWTFNSELYTGRFPLETWNADDADSLSMGAVEFIGRQPFEKKSHLEKALVRLNEVIRSSDLITVFLISSGEDKITGTPFDQTINRYYAQDLKEMGKARMPLVTVLEAKGGQIFDFTVNALPWPIVVHPLPIPPEPVEIPSIATAPATTPESTLPNGLVELPKGSPRVQPLIIRGPPPKPVDSNAVSTTAPLQPMTTTQLITNLPSTSAALRSETVFPPPATNAIVSVVGSNPPPVMKPVTAAASPPPVLTTATLPAQVVTSPTPANPASEVASRPTSVPPIQSLAVVSPPPDGHSGAFLIVGSFFLLVGVGLLLVLVRRSRATTGPSLITHSMGNPRK